MARKPTPGTRDRILDKAGCLFAERGINAVGLQQVIDACGCGKNLLYREFASKDDLVVAYLNRQAEESMAAIDAVIAKHAGDPTAQLVGIVENAVACATSPEYKGCHFQSATAEFRDPEHPVHQASVAHIHDMHKKLLGIARKAGARSPKELADRLMLIIDGVYSSATLIGPKGPAKTAVELAEVLVRDAVAP